MSFVQQYNHVICQHPNGLLQKVGSVVKSALTFSILLLYLNFIEFVIIIVGIILSSFVFIIYLVFTPKGDS